VPTPRKYESAAARQKPTGLARPPPARIRSRAACRRGAGIPTMPSAARWRSLKEGALRLLETLEGEMRAYADERSEAWQESERGEAFEEAVDLVAEAAEAVRSIP